MAPSLRPALVLLLTGLTLWLAPAPSQAADETAQVLMLKRLFSSPEPDWPGILAQHRALLDASFFERSEKRIRWSLDNAQVEDAFRFAIMGDLAGAAVGRPTSYRLEMARFFLGLNNGPMAMDLLTNILALRPDDLPALFLKASILHDSGGASQIDAYEIYGRLVKAGHRKADCLYRMALIDLQRGQDQTARGALEEALRLDPSLSLARQELDRILSYERSLTFVPGQPTPTGPPPGPTGPGPATSPGSSRGQGPTPARDPARALRSLVEGEERRGQGDLAAALTLYQRAVTEDPSLVPARLAWGGASFQQRDLDAAITQFTEASRLQPQDPAPWRYLGYSLERRFESSQDRADLSEALEAFERAAALEPGSGRVLGSLARVRGKLAR